MRTAVLVTMNANNEIAPDVKTGLERIAYSLAGQERNLDDPLAPLRADYADLLDTGYLPSPAALLALRIRSHQHGEISLTVHDLDAPINEYTGDLYIDLAEPDCFEFYLTEAVSKVMDGWNTIEDAEHDLTEQIGEKIRRGDITAVEQSARLTEFFLPTLTAGQAFEPLVPAEIDRVPLDKLDIPARAGARLREIVAALTPAPAPAQ